MLLTLGLTLFLSACSSPPQPLAATYENVQVVFSRSCAVGQTSCHSATGTMVDLRLDPANVFTTAVGVQSSQATRRIIDPGNPDRSYILNKLNDTMYTLPECDRSIMSCGVRMPMVGGPGLPTDEIDLIRRWILAGAPGPASADAGRD